MNSETVSILEWPWTTPVRAMTNEVAILLSFQMDGLVSISQMDGSLLETLLGVGAIVLFAGDGFLASGTDRHDGGG